MKKYIYVFILHIQKDIYDDINTRSIIEGSAKSFKLDESTNIYSGIYAWTTRKEYADMFLSYRDKEIYKVIKIKNTKEYRKYLKHLYEDFEIQEEWLVNNFSKARCDHEDYNKLRKNDKLRKKYCVPVCLTRNELLNSTLYMSENYDIVIQNHFNYLVDYMFFTDDFLELVDNYVSYSYLYDAYSPKTDDSRMDNANWSRSYNLTSIGNKIPYTNISEYHLFLYLYKYPIFGR